MAAKESLTWFSYRRRRWLAGFGIALVLVLATILFAGGSPDVVVYNDSSRPLGPVRIEAGGVRREFPPLAPQESAVLSLPLRVGGELALWLPGEPPRRITGPWVEAGETAQVVARVDEFGEVMFSQLPTWRARLVGALR